MNKIYICIDLKSFYASVECVDRGLDPLLTNLVVADNSRTEKTICLAVTPSLKQYGLSGRSRLFEVVSKVKEINYERKKQIKYNFKGSSVNDIELKNNKYLKLDYIVAPPRMKRYMKVSTEIYNTYLEFVSKDDIYPYSIDEVFIDVTNYLKLYKATPSELATRMVKRVYDKTGITATAGIGTNMYLAKIAMDIVAKHSDANEFGVRIASLDEFSYRRLLWNHRPLTDFWRIGKGISKKLEQNFMYTMGDVARKSLTDENLLFKLFGVNAELIIDHAWGYEPCTMRDVKNFKPSTNSLSSGQVLHEPYTFKNARTIIKEMSELLTLDMASKDYLTDLIVIHIDYDISSLDNYDGEVKKDYYGRIVPKPAHGTIRIDHMTKSTDIIRDKVVELYDKIVNPKLLVRKLNITVCNLKHSSSVDKRPIYKQFDLFTNIEEEDKKIKATLKKESSELEIQNTLLKIKNKYGKNSILKATDLYEEATTIDRNNQVGGHKG